MARQGGVAATEMVFDMFAPLEEKHSIWLLKRLYEHQIPLPTSTASEIFNIPEDKVKAIEMEVEEQTGISCS
jgi:hypothetical protein